MRPVNRLRVGDTITIVKSSGISEEVTIKNEYAQYADAKPALVENLGPYCSYCERCIPYDSIHVEHIEPKTLSQKTGNQYYEHNWSNFLLSCGTCNSCKGTTHFLPSNIVLPHQDNTYQAFVYSKGGLVEANPNEPRDIQERARNTLTMVKLSRTESDCTGADFRWKQRLEAWNIAEDMLRDFQEAKKENVKSIVRYVVKAGMWSIWFTVFKDVHSVREALLDSFPGTAKQCFDATNLYEPLKRTD